MYVYMYVSDQLVAIGYVYGTHTYIHTLYVHTYIVCTYIPKEVDTYSICTLHCHIDHMV